MIKIRASSLGKIMTPSRGKTEILSETAKSYLNQIASEHVLDYYKVIDTKPMKKGKQCEQDSIDLVNSFLFENYEKNSERKENEFLTGECDIFTGNSVIDIKTSWDKSTFPLLPDEGQNDDYEWQLRAYMILWDVDSAMLAYCLVNTPDELTTYEQQDLHYVDDVKSALRITFINYERDKELEEKIIEKCIAAQEYLANRIDQINKFHGVN